MLYPALPPAAPPPVIVTLTPQSSTARIASSQRLYANKVVNQPTQNQQAHQDTDTRQQRTSVNCHSQSASSVKPNLVSNLLTKILINSYGKESGCQGLAPTESTSTTIVSQAVDHQGLQTNLKLSSAVTEANQDKNLDKSPNQTPTSQLESANLQSNQPQIAANPNNLNTHINGDNPVGKILATVQELVAVSLYASLNPALNNITSQPTPVNSENASTASTKDSQVARIDSNADKSETLLKNQLENNQPTSESQGSNQQNTTTIASTPRFDSARIIAIVQGLINASISASVNQNLEYKVTLNPDKSNLVASSQNPVTSEANSQTNNSQISDTQITGKNEKLVAALSNRQPQINNSSNSTTESNPNKPESTIQLAKAPGEPFLVAVTINGREVGTLDIIQEGNTLLIPLEAFAEVASFTVEKSGSGYTVKTPLGEVKLPENSLRKLNGVTYISGDELATKLRVALELNTADLTLAADLPWRGGSQQARKVELKPEFFAPNNGISTFRQELNITRVYDQTKLRSSTQLGGRLAGGSWRMRLNNNFVNQPDIAEYFFYKRTGQFRYQVGRQQVGLHPLINSIDLTGLQFGFSNLPAESFGSSYSANELLPRRSRPIQTFTGQAPPASIAQLRIGGIPVAQQVVGFDGQYEFVDVNLPIGQNNEVEVAIFDRSNLNVPMTVRSVRINASDLLLPAGGNVQIGGLGFSGNLVQDTFFDDIKSDFNGKFVGFYQLRQGLANNLTFEGSLQAAPDAFQSQAGLIWRLANPVVLSASVGTSDEKMGYTAELDVQLDRLEINANSQSLPEGFSRTRGRGEKFNHSVEVSYRPGNNLNIGFIARKFKDEITDSNYILPTFTVRPFSTLSLNGRPDIEGRYLLNAFYQPNWKTRLALSSFGGIYNSNLTYRFARDYELSLGNEFGDNTPGRYAISVGRNPGNFRSLAWSLGLAVREGEVAPLASASMQVLPGLLARLEYQGIPSRSRGLFGGFGDDRFTVSLVSDLSFARGRITPATYSGISKERGAIAGRLTFVNSARKPDLAGSRIRVVNNRNRIVGSTVTDASGNFFVGGLQEGIYTVELEPDELPVEISTQKTSFVAEVANSAVTKLDFPLRIEYGLAGRITDVAGQPVGEIQVELVNQSGARVISGTTDEYGLYRLDGVPIGKYTLQVSRQEDFNPNDSLPKRAVEISNEFVYNQNLKLPVTAAALKQKQAR